MAWLAAAVGSRFSYDFDDIATLKLVTAVPVLFSTYALVAIIAGVGLGWVWLVLALLMIPASFLATLFCLGETGPTAHLDAKPASLGTPPHGPPWIATQTPPSGGCWRMVNDAHRRRLGCSGATERAPWVAGYDGGVDAGVFGYQVGVRGAGR